MKKKVLNEKEWGIVASELSAEKIKIQSYDKKFIQLLGNIKNKRILDYGAGPGILASVLLRLQGDTYVFDISEEMNEIAAMNVGIERVYHSADKIPYKTFDIVVCNLVLCIVDIEETKNICTNIYSVLKNQGRAYIGFCNPLIYNIPETQLDYRKFEGSPYELPHSYFKIKKEGNYEIKENHRPVEWYKKIFKESGFKKIDIHFTDEYELNAIKIKDFIIFELIK